VGGGVGATFREACLNFGVDGQQSDNMVCLYVQSQNAKLTSHLQAEFCKMPPRKGKDDSSKKSKTTGPAMATRSRTVNQRVEAFSSPPDGRRKRTGDGKRKKPQSKVEPERLDNLDGCGDTTEPQQLDLKELSKRGTWGILQNVKERVFKCLAFPVATSF